MELALRHRLSILWIALILSVGVHVLSLMKRIELSSPFERVTQMTASDPVEIVEMPKMKRAAPVKKLSKEIVESEEAGNREIDPEAKFLSDKNQRAEVESRAKEIGAFHEKEGDGTAGLMSRPAETGFPPDVVDGEGEVAVSQQNKNWNALSLKDLSVGTGGESAHNDSVGKEVGAGDRTVLSTREFRYFAYYQRIRDLLRQHWGPNVQAKLQKLWQMGKAVNAEEWTTELHILLDGSGRVQKIAKVAGCGLSEIDSAAVEAFQRAGPFPNPPKGLLDDDGYVRINWSFILTTESAPRVQFSTPGPVGPPN
ncbi:MAG: TonB family protein [Deltaproteobacteria bacterium]|nr:TonB family protein [Deltaproteobacteria bacterium]